MREFRDGMRQIQARVQKAKREGMEKAALALMTDCVMEEPKAPHNYGTLRASGSVFVNDEFVQAHVFPVDGGGDQPAPLTELTTPERVASELRGTVAFNQPYAANLHEGLRYDRKTKSLVPVQEWGMTRHYERGKESAEE